MTKVENEGASILSGKKDGFGMLLDQEKHQITECLWFNDFPSSRVRVVSNHKSYVVIPQ